MKNLIRKLFSKDEGDTKYFFGKRYIWLCNEWIHIDDLHRIYTKHKL